MLKSLLLISFALVFIFFVIFVVVHGQLTNVIPDANIPERSQHNAA